MQGHTGSITLSAGLEQFQVVDCIELEFETWMKRMARAKGLPYRGSGFSKEWKRKGWLEAYKYFETVGEEPRKIGISTLIIERVQAFVKSIFERWR